MNPDPKAVRRFINSTAIAQGVTLTFAIAGVSALVMAADKLGWAVFLREHWALGIPYVIVCPVLILMLRSRLQKDIRRVFGSEIGKDNDAMFATGD